MTQRLPVLDEHLQLRVIAREGVGFCVTLLRRRRFFPRKKALVQVPYPPLDRIAHLARLAEQLGHHLAADVRQPEIESSELLRQP